MTATVLIVDDSTFIVEGLVALLRKQYRVLTSGGGRECLCVLATEKPDVIVLDILMEPMDGWETLSRIKADPATRFIPVLLFSAKKITPGDAEVCHDQVARFLLKPVNPRELIAEIEAILAREDRHRRLQADWAKAGVPRQQIEEYLITSSNLDADRSLLAVLKKQAGQFVAEKDLSSELEGAIAVLEERIVREQEVVSGFPGRNRLPSSGPHLCPEACAPAGAEPVSPPVPDPPVVTMPEPVQGPAAGDAGGVFAMIDEAPLAVPPVWGSPFVPLAPEEEPEALPDRDVWGMVELAADEEPGAPGKDPEPDPSLVPAAEPVPEETPGDPGSAAWIHIPAHAGVPEPVYSSGIDEFLEDDPSPASPAPSAASPRDMMPLPAACSMPVPAAAESRQEPAGEPVQAAAPRQPTGFFSRIIAIIAGIFGRGRC